MTSMVASVQGFNMNIAIIRQTRLVIYFNIIVLNELKLTSCSCFRKIILPLAWCTFIRGKELRKIYRKPFSVRLLKIKL